MFCPSREDSVTRAEIPTIFHSSKRTCTSVADEQLKIYRASFHANRSTPGLVFAKEIELVKELSREQSSGPEVIFMVQMKPYSKSA